MEIFAHDEVRLKVVETASVNTWSQFSISFIQAAAMFTREALQLEGQPLPSDDQTLLHQHRSYVLGAVTMSTAFLEASVNELFAGTADEMMKAQLMTQLGTEKIEILGRLWAQDDLSSKASVLNKYQLALKVTGNTEFDRGRTPYQNVKSLIALRNWLLHYKPEWIGGAGTPKKEHDIEKKLRRKFALNPLLPHNPVFPDQMLSHGCAAWAVNSSIEFADEFFLRMGLNPWHNHVRDALLAE